MLLTGNVGGQGMAANILRGHDNVQAPPTSGLDIVTLPFYYGLVEGAWRHWSRVWETDYAYLQSRFDSKTIKETPGIPLTRWFDAATLPKGSGCTKRCREGDVRPRPRQQQHQHAYSGIDEGLKALELLVVADPHPTTWASLAVQAGRTDNMYLLPVCSQFEASGSRVATNRSMQWGEQIVKPIFESKNDLEILYLMATKFGFADKMFKNIKVENNVPVPEDVLREMNRGSWSTGYCGQSPERIKATHEKPGQVRPEFRCARPRTIRKLAAITTDCPGRAGVRRRSGIRERRCCTTPTSTSWTAAAHSARVSVWSAKRRQPTAPLSKVSLLANGSYSKDSEIKDGYPEFHARRPEEARLGY